MCDVNCEFQWGKFFCFRNNVLTMLSFIENGVYRIEIELPDYV